MPKNLSWTQGCVLRVLAEHGGALSWRDIEDEVRRRSGRAVRPNASTLRTLRKRGLLTLSITWVSLTDTGRAMTEDATKSPNG